MKKTLSIILFIIMVILTFCLVGCSDKPIEDGVYVNESVTSQSVEIKNSRIRFINVNFDDLSNDLQNDFGIDFQLTEKLKVFNAFYCEKGEICIEIFMGIEISFEYKNNYIIINNSKFIKGN